MLGTLSSNGVLLGIAAGIGFAVATFLFVGLIRGAPRILVALLALGVVATIVIGIWAVVRPTSGIAETPMVAATPLSTPAGSALPPGSPGPSPGGTPSTGPSPQACSPSGSTASLTEVVQNVAYQSPCLGAPAQQAFTISFDNKDAGIPHDMHIFSADPASDPSATTLFMGTIVTGPATQTYDVPALPAGHYFFHCDVHPTTMKGELIVGP